MKKLNQGKRYIYIAKEDAISSSFPNGIVYIKGLWNQNETIATKKKLQEDSSHKINIQKCKTFHLSSKQTENK